MTYPPMLLTSGGHHWRPVQTPSLDDFPPPVLTSSGGVKRAVRILMECILVSGCIFRENERALSLYSRFKFVEVDQCEFIGNEAVHSGEIFASALKRHRSTFTEK